MMYTETESTTFHMLAPQKGTYLLDIFSAKYPNYEMCQKKEATKYINVCRFRVNCTGVDKVNVPLPECAPGKCNSSILKIPCPKFWKFRSRFFLKPICTYKQATAVVVSFIFYFCKRNAVVL